MSDLCKEAKAQASEAYEFSKMSFSMLGDEGAKKKIIESGRKQMVLYGGETHSAVL
jgi:hypothetical protein